jgi:hypothetical protein
MKNPGGGSSASVPTRRSFQLEDYDMVKGLHAAGATGTCDASVDTKEHQTGTVPLNTYGVARRRGAWDSAAPTLLSASRFHLRSCGSAAVDAAAAGDGRHRWRGMSRADANEFEDLIDQDKPPLSFPARTPLRMP